MRHIVESEDITTPLSVTFDEGIPFESKGYDEKSYGPAITVRDPRNFDCNGLRVAHMEISTWRGISCGAQHYYARIRFSGTTFRQPDGQPHPRAYTYPNGMPREAEGMEIEVRRPVTQRDVDYAKKRGDGWIPRSGDYVRGFWEEKEAYDAGIACFKEKFAPGWVLQTHDPDTGNLIEIARS